MKEQNIVLIRDANISFWPIFDLLILDDITNLTAFPLPFILAIS